MNTQSPDHIPKRHARALLQVARERNTRVGVAAKHWLAQKLELSRGNGAANIRPMEGLRGFAVFLVFLVHYVTLVTPWVPEHSSVHPLAEALHTVGNAGVDLFFVLSGYLIYGSLIARRQNFLRFMSRRVERIYPTFLVVLGLYVGLSYVFPAESKIPATLAEAVVYLAQNVLLLPGLFAIDPVITVAWSLSYEMFYYLAMPPIILLFGLRQRSGRTRTAFFVSVGVLIAVFCAMFEGPVRLIMFIAGVLLYEAMASTRVPTPTSGLALVALTGGLLAMLLPTQGAPGFVFKLLLLFGAFFMLGLTCFRAPAAWLPRGFSWTPLRWLGNMSYSYYLLHGLALKATFLVVGKVLPATVLAAAAGAWLFWGLLPLAFALTLLPTAALFLLVERPLSLSPRSASAPAPAAELALPAKAKN